MDIGTLLTVAGAFFIVAASPGPANLGCALVSMRHGRRAGLQFGVGLSVGLAVWGVLAAAGLGAVLQTSEKALIALKLIGAGYLFWLAWQSGRSAARRMADVKPAATSARWLRQGVLLNLSNPKAVFAWMAALAMGLDADAGVGAVGIATFVCALIGLANYLVWAVLFSAGPALRIYQRLRRWLEGVVAGLFALAGLGMLRSALTR
ncbi:amino acid transporter [Roseobacter cerasinus]|uniref:Amino acid transporter n=1 Tax=Roseobacter cerasinus TaxID=2602289 RepID=A0A640VSJ3_9RHOB|nr:LysE family translocator [Roseobacter cerasinus]GFE50989.1 amino acid transporter [Roseobacter cerasinus]